MRSAPAFSVTEVTTYGSSHCQDNAVALERV